MKHDNLRQRRYLRVRSVAARYQVSPATIWRWAATVDGFPKPVKITSGTTAWSESALDEYDDRRAAESQRAAA